MLVLAQEEARLLNHGFIGTEHILMGLIHEEEGVAAMALKSLDVSLGAVRERVKETIGIAVNAPGASPPFTPRAKKVLELSLREALQLGHSYIGTEHMLLGVVREGEGVAAQVLVGLGADLDRVRQEVIRLMPGSQGHTWSTGEGPPERARPKRLSSTQPAGSGVSGTPRVCSFCGRDLWEVGRYVSTGTATTICEDCLRIALGALETYAPDRGGEVPFPPRLFGTAPDEDAVEQVVAAFRTSFGPDPDRRNALENVDELEPYMAEARQRQPGEATPIRVERLRFLDGDTAEVQFQVGLVGGPGVTYNGTAVRRGGHWMVSRDTMAQVLRPTGVIVPPRPAAQ